ncbi:DUF4102 domain-containing protein [Salmonella enterica subsp. salamae]|nr:DUF4102 domain-containing protein [Salmonella enterica subsp. salamae]
MRLNDSIIKNLKSTDQSYYVFRNDGTRGTGRLGIKVFSSGRKSFVYRFQLDGKRKFKTGLITHLIRPASATLNWQE